MNDTTWSDEELMAFADGQLAGERAARLAEAVERDASLRARVDALAAQRRRVAAAFADVLDEPVPDRLSALLAPPAVIDLAAERQRRAPPPAPAPTRRPGAGWLQWGGMAASLVLGLLLGWQLGWQLDPRGAGGDALLSEADGQLVAGTRLARVLEGQAGGEAGREASAGGLSVPLSFVDREGRYCRAFSGERVAGLACRDATHWSVQTTVAAAAAGASADSGSGMRPAATALPPALLDAIDARIDGAALSAEQEKAARDRGWRR